MNKIIDNSFPKEYKYEGNKSEDERIKLFFNGLWDNYLPSYILPDSQHVDTHISSILEKFNQLELQLLDNLDKNKETLDSKKFKEKFCASLDDIALFIIDKINTPYNYELKPILRLVFFLINQFDDILYINRIKELRDETNEIKQRTALMQEQLEKLNNPPPQNSFWNKWLVKFNEKYNKPHTETPISEDLWKDMAKESLSLLKKDFNFKSIHINGRKSWKEIYEWSCDTYRAIQSAQHNVGLDKSTTGLNGTLNICFSDKELDIIHALGGMYPDKHSNTILLRHLPHVEQIKIWQHEYAHTLDNRAAINYLRDVNGNSDEHRVYLSSLVMDSHIQGVPLEVSKDISMENTKVWISESLSAIIGGTDSNSFENFQKENKENYIKKINENLFQLFLPNKEEDWLNLNDSTIKIIHNHPALADFAPILLNTLYSYGKEKTIKLLNDESDESNIKQVFDLFTNALYSCANIKIPKEDFLKSCKKTLSDEKENIISKLYCFINNKGYNFDKVNNNFYFAKSISVMASINYSLITETDYWSKTIEIFARSTENLQTPLIIGSTIFHEQEQFKKPSNSFLSPQLDFNERFMLVCALQGMAKLAGVTVITDPNDVPCLNKEINRLEIEHINHHISHDDLVMYTTATGNNHKSQSILNIAKVRVSNNEKKFTKHKI